MTHAYFNAELFDFLRELRVNNNRDWFQRNRPRYEKQVRDPALQFIAAMAPQLGQISPHLIADPRPVGGSLFRINRDIRFAADKSPYKTAVGMSFGHDRGRDRAAPGLYLQLAPDESFGGGGIHMPDGPTLTKIRDAIVRRPDAWLRTTTDPAFAPAFVLMGESLKRAPKGYEPNHPHVADLKRKSFVWHVRFDEAEVCAADFADRFLSACRIASPFHRYLAEALDVAW